MIPPPALDLTDVQKNKIGQKGTEQKQCLKKALPTVQNANGRLGSKKDEARKEE